MKVSREGIALLKNLETFRPRAQPRPGGGWVIGYGHTQTARQGARITEPDAELLLQYDLVRISQAINTHARRQLNQHQFDALASFALSIGVERFMTSDVLAQLNAGEINRAADAMIGWPEPALVATAIRRRTAERALFNTDPAKPAGVAKLLTLPLAREPVIAPEPVPASPAPAAETTPETLVAADVETASPESASLEVKQIESDPSDIGGDAEADVAPVATADVEPVEANPSLAETLETVSPFPLDTHQAEVPEPPAALEPLVDSAGVEGGAPEPVTASEPYFGSDPTEQEVTKPATFAPLEAAPTAEPDPIGASADDAAATTTPAPTEDTPVDTSPAEGEGTADAKFAAPAEAPEQTWAAVPDEGLTLAQTDDADVAVSETPQPPEQAPDFSAPTTHEPLVEEAAVAPDAEPATPAMLINEPADWSSVPAADLPATVETPAPVEPAPASLEAPGFDSPVESPTEPPIAEAADTALTLPRFEPYAGPIVGDLPFGRETAAADAGPFDARHAFGPLGATTGFDQAQTASAGDGELLVLTPPAEAAVSTARPVWGDDARTTSDFSQNALFEDVGAMHGRTIASLHREDSEAEPPRLNWGQTSAFLIMAAIGLVSFGMAMAAFRLASQQSGRADQTSMIGWVLAVIGATCVGVAAFNLYRRWGRPEAE